MTTKNSTASASLWSPLRQPAFRGLWACGGIFFVGNGMQTMAAAWLMVELTGSSFLAALVQTAVFLPMFLLALPAGVLADTTDRRRFISGALLGQCAATALLTVLVLAGWGGPVSVLLLVFVGGCCTAALTPAWNSSVIDPVPRDEWPQAITAVSIAYNAARAVGPTLAGLVFAHLGAGWVFAVTVATTLVMWESIRRWPPRPHPPSHLPAERLWGGTLSGLRFAWHSHMILAQLVRVMAFSAAGSALWALLPVIAQRLGTGAQGFGLLMGCLGTGAVAVGLVLGRLRARFGLEAIVGAGGVVFGAAMLAAALAPMAWLVYAALLFAGAAWMSAMSTFNTATQASAPQWVRSRAVAMHMVAALGAFALGSAFWGAASDVVGLTPTLCVAAALMVAGLLLARPLPLRMGALHEVTQVATPWDELFVEPEPPPEAGPVAVELGYRIAPGADAAFLDAIGRLKAPRRRDGASFWRVYKDLGEPSRYVERFIVASWADYLHQRARATMADQALEAEVRAFLAPGEAVHMAHYIAER
ncbi:MAG: MFS transporter [Acidovorax sp.]|uniref:MFS transporter n=1 Tax=Acidovorax sp. TaxID=1872122 RepID=UPI0039E6BE0A